MSLDLRRRSRAAAPDKTDVELFALAQRLHAQIVAIRQDVTMRVFTLGQLLSEMHEQQLYVQLGHETWVAYLGELSIRRSTAYQWMELYRTYAKKLRVANASVVLSHIDFQKLYMMRPIVNAENLSEWLAKAQSLPRSELREEIAEAKREQLRHGYKPAGRLPPPPPGMSEAMRHAGEVARLHEALLGAIIADVTLDPRGLHIVTEDGIELRVGALAKDDLALELRRVGRMPDEA